MTIRLIYLLLFTFLLSPISHAEEWDEDDDLEHFFSTRQKSTLSDFPLQEIAGDELSDAAIAGALRANTSSSLTAKPIYEQEAENSSKEQAAEALEKDELLKFSNEQTPGLFPTAAPDLIQPIYQAPTGRTYGGHHTHTVERP